MQEALDRLATERTTITVAHRLSTVRGASRIAACRDGQVVEVGTHAELYANSSGVYHALVQLQEQAAAAAQAADVGSGTLILSGRQSSQAVLASEAGEGAKVALPSTAAVKDEVEAGETELVRFSLINTHTHVQRVRRVCV